MKADFDYQFEWDKKYCYPNSRVLKNKLGIADAESFKISEREITSVVMQEIMEYPVEGHFDFDHLRAIHKSLFEDIFSWAGEIRTVDISKGSYFCSSHHIEKFASALFNELKKENYLKPTNPSDLCSRLAYYFAEINALHPFREGNRRTQRIFILCLAESLGYTLHYAKVTDREMMNASVESFNGNNAPLESLFEKIIEPLN
jgi:cell filamentation protein